MPSSIRVVRWNQSVRISAIQRQSKKDLRKLTSRMQHKDLQKSHQDYNMYRYNK
jgi:hypothetical protein